MNSESFNGVLNSIEITLAHSKLKVITVIVTPDSISIQQSLSLLERVVLQESTK